MPEIRINDIHMQSGKIAGLSVIPAIFMGLVLYKKALNQWAFDIIDIIFLLTCCYAILLAFIVVFKARKRVILALVKEDDIYTFERLSKKLLVLKRNEFDVKPKWDFYSSYFIRKEANFTSGKQCYIIFFHGKKIGYLLPELLEEKETAYALANEMLGDSEN